MTGHMPMVQGIEAARRLKAGRTLFTHIGHRAGLPRRHRGDGCHTASASPTTAWSSTL